MSSERRNCRRFPVPDHRSPATVKVGRKQYEARLIDVSATGYRLLTLKSAKVKRGSRVLVVTDNGESECVVAYTTPEGETFQCLGLFRVRENTTVIGQGRRPVGSRCSHGAPPLFVPGIVLGAIVLVVCSYLAFDVSAMMAKQKTSLSWIRQLAYRD